MANVVALAERAMLSGGSKTKGQKMETSNILLIVVGLIIAYFAIKLILVVLPLVLLAGLIFVGYKLLTSPRRERV